MYPDLGIYLIEQEYKEPFKLTVYSGLTLGQDSILGWVIGGITNQFQASGIEAQPAPMISEAMM